MNDEPEEEGLAPSSAAEEAITEPLIGLANDRNASAEERTRASILIEEQIKLARLQRAHLKTQHIRDRFLVAFDLALAIGGAVIVAAIFALLWDAWSAHSVVIDQFDGSRQLRGPRLLRQSDRVRNQGRLARISAHHAHKPGKEIGIGRLEQSHPAADSGSRHFRR